MAKRRLTADEVATSAKLAGVPPALALAIWEQESGKRTDVPTSDRGAYGPFQVTVPTFRQYNPGGNIDDPVDNMNAALSYMGSLLKRYNGDWEKVAQAYYHGSALAPGVRGPTSGPGTPDTRAYGEQIVAKAKAKDTSPSLTNLAVSPAKTTTKAPVATSDLYGNSLRPATLGGSRTRTPPLGPSAPPGPWIDPIWHNLTAQPAPGAGVGAGLQVAQQDMQDLGDLGPQEPMVGGYGGGEQDQIAMQQGGDNYDMDQFVRRLVDDIV